VAREVFEEQIVDPDRHLVGRVMSDAGERHEAVIRFDELGGAFRRDPTDCVVGLAQMNKVGTLVGAIGYRSPRARYQARAASIAGAFPITDRCFSIASRGTPLRASRSRTHFPFSASSRGPALGSSNSWWWRERRGCSGSVFMIRPLASKSRCACFALRQPA
jgi:hypothetical protein